VVVLRRLETEVGGWVVEPDGRAGEEAAAFLVGDRVGGEEAPLHSDGGGHARFKVAVGVASVKTWWPSWRVSASNACWAEQLSAGKVCTGQ